MAGLLRLQIDAKDVCLGLGRLPEVLRTVKHSGGIMSGIRMTVA